MQTSQHSEVVANCGTSCVCRMSAAAVVIHPPISENRNRTDGSKQVSLSVLTTADPNSSHFGSTAVASASTCCRGPALSFVGEFWRRAQQAGVTSSMLLLLLTSRGLHAAAVLDNTNKPSSDTLICLRELWYSQYSDLGNNTAVEAVEGARAAMRHCC